MSSGIARVLGKMTNGPVNKPNSEVERIKQEAALALEQQQALMDRATKLGIEVRVRQRK